MDRTRLFAAADLLIEKQRPEEESGPILEGIFESLYRLADAPQHLEELEGCLSSYALRARAACPWLALVRIARKTSGQPLEGAFESLDATLSRWENRATLVLKTEAARHLHRITGDARQAWNRLAGEPLPDASLGDVATEAAVVRLRLAAVAGAWEEHDRLANALASAWTGVAGRGLSWIHLVVAEHEIQRGAYAAALDRLLPLESESQVSLRWASLGERLHALLACGGDRPGTALNQEIRRTASLLKLLTSAGMTEGTPLTAAEWEERRHRCNLLLHYAGFRDRATEGENQPTLSDALALEQQDPEAALEIVNNLLLTPGVEEAPEIAVRCKLLWIRLALSVSSTAETVESCEDMASTVLSEAKAQGLPVLEMLAWDQRALIRRWYFESRWAEAVSDAGQAANLALDLLDRNRDSFVERSLRATLLPILDRTVSWLTEGALRAILGNPEDAAMHERFGRTILDYVEASMELALSEARNRMRFEEPMPLPRAVPGASKHSTDLQAPLRAREAVLQYFLVESYLLVFAYGREFFTWHAEKIQNEHQPLPVRDHLKELLYGREETHLAPERHGASSREDTLRDVKRPGLRQLQARRSQTLTNYLLPSKIQLALKGHRVNQLAIVPHDVLYRIPFSRLPWGATQLGVGFNLSLHPTGGLASSHSSWHMGKRRTQVGFFIGPDLEFANHEADALRKALHRAAEVAIIDTAVERKDFGREASNCSILYLACHGQSSRDKPGDAYLMLGPEGGKVTLSQVAALDLQSCGLAVLQACWTGWMDHLREFPVQGFPQGLRDAGVAAVIAPMFPVADPLCPIFTAVFCRTLRFLPVGDALSYTLKLLRTHGQILVADIPLAAKLWTKSAFDEYEYRLTGDVSIRLIEGWWRQQVSRLQFYGWLWWKILRMTYMNRRAKSELSS